MGEFVERISKWHAMLRPVLATSEKRNNFDIHALGTDIMDKFNDTTVTTGTNDETDSSVNTKSTISFGDVMNGRDETYTARYFLSLLLLTNNKNVYLDVAHPERNGDEICSPDDIKIGFRNRTRHWDEVNRIEEHLEVARAQTENSSSQMPYKASSRDAPVAKGKNRVQKRKWNE